MRMRETSWEPMGNNETTTWPSLMVTPSAAWSKKEWLIRLLGQEVSQWDSTGKPQPMRKLETKGNSKEILETTTGHYWLWPLRGLEQERIANKSAWTRGQPMRFYRKPTWPYPAVSTSRVANEKAWNKGEFKGNLWDNHCMIITDCDTFGALSKREQPMKMLEQEGMQPMRFYLTTT